MNYLLKLPKVTVSCRFSHNGLRSISNVFSQGSCSLDVQKKSFLRLSLTSISSSRTFWETFPYLTRNLYARDGFNPEKYQIVCRSNVFNYLFYGQLITQIAIITQVLYALNVIFQVYVLENPVPTMDTFGTIPIKYDLTSFFILSLFSFQILCVYHCIQLIVLRIYRKVDSGEYVIISMSHNPLKLRQTFCKKCDVENLNIEGYKAFLGNFRCKERKFFINPSTFRNMSDYVEFLGNNDEDKEE